jgi:riboflavin biosynthesis pyrimidine reductase
MAIPRAWLLRAIRAWEDPPVRSLLGTEGVEVVDDDLTNLYRFPDTEGRAWVRAIFISSADGSAQGPDQASASLSSPGDRRVFGLQRSLCDLVLVGAGTARAERYRPVQLAEVDVSVRHGLGLADTPAIAVVSRSLAIDPGLLGPGPAQTLLVTTLDAAAGVPDSVDRGRLVRAGTGVVDLAGALDELARRGYRRVLCEGGPTLLAHLLAAGRLDDLCLTIAPTMLAGDHRRIAEGPDLDPPIRLRLAHLLEEEEFLFARYLVG